MLNKKRPVNLALTTMKFPVMAIASIMHRLSGLLLAVSVPIFLYLLSMSLKSEQQFTMVSEWLAHPVLKVCLWGVLTGLFYHLLAGIRHMIMDLGFGEEVGVAKVTALVVMVGAAIISIAVGVWLW